MNASRPRVEWPWRTSKQADLDLYTIWSHIAEDNPGAADRIADLIADKYQFLASFPMSGTAGDEYAPGLRYFVAGNYVILYRLIDTGIEIARVVHGSRDIPSLFRNL